VWSILRRQNTLEQITEHLQVTDVSHWCDLLESGASCLQTDRHVLVKQNGEVGALRLRLARVDPTARISVMT